MTEPPVSIGAAAARLGLSTRALRYYEQVGLLTPTARTDGGNRLYSEDDLARVLRIREMQDLLGADLESIRGILAHEDRMSELREAYHGGEADRIAVLQEALVLHGGLLEDVDARLRRLQDLRDSVETRRQRVATLLDEQAART